MVDLSFACNFVKFIYFKLISYIQFQMHQIFLVNESFHRYVVILFISHNIFFAPVSILSKTNRGIPAFLEQYWSGISLFQLINFHLSLLLFFKLMLYKQHIDFVGLKILVFYPESFYIYQDDLFAQINFYHIICLFSFFSPPLISCILLNRLNFFVVVFTLKYPYTSLEVKYFTSILLVFPLTFQHANLIFKFKQFVLSSQIM